jgi:hypothetical protein
MFSRVSIFTFGLLVVFGFAAQRPGATYLLIPVGARQSGMAYAFSAVADDASANYYNAAGLAFLDTPQITGTYLGYLLGLHPDMHHIYIAAAYPFGKSCVGLDFTYYTPGTVSFVDYEGQYLGERVVWRIVPKISYVRRLNEKLALGLSWKYIKQQYGERDPWDWSYIDWTGSSWAFDFCGFFKILPSLSAGTGFHNIGPDIEYPVIAGIDPLPRIFRLGVAYMLIQTNEISVLISGELTKVLVGMFADEQKSFWQHVGYEFDEGWKAVGLEITMSKIASLRGGFFYDNEGAREGFTFGMGLNYVGLSLDIGIDEHVYEFETENRRISLSYVF